MLLYEALALPDLARIRVVAGQRGLDREVRWVHVVDIPDVRSWVRPGHLLLTTGYAWPRNDDEQRTLITQLYQHGLAGIGMAIPQFFEQLPLAATEQAEALGFPLLEIPWEIPFATITEVISRALLAEQTSILKRSEVIHRSLTRAALELDSLEGILHRIAVTLGYTCHFLDANGHPVASQHQHNEVGAELPDVSLVSEARQLVGKADCPLQVSAEGRSWLIGPVRLRQRLQGFLVLVNEGGTPFTDLDLRAVEHAATVVALFLSYQHRIDLVQARLRYGLVNSLIEGRYDPTAAREKARHLAFDTEGTYKVCIFLLCKETVPLDGEDAFMRRERVASEIHGYLTRNGWPALLTVSLNRVVAVLPAEADPREVAALFDPDDIAVGVSGPCVGMEAIPRAFRQAEQALAWNGFKGFCLYSETMVPRILAGDAAARLVFLEQMLGPLMNARGSERLLSTLRAFARSGFSHKETARAMHVHPNTLRYRLRRLESCLGLDFSDPETRFRLRLAVEILDVNDKNPPKES